MIIGIDPMVVISEALESDIELEEVLDETPQLWAESAEGPCCED